MPYFSNRLHVSRIALCSVTQVMMWSPFSAYISATPLMARLWTRLRAGKNDFFRIAIDQRADPDAGVLTISSAFQPNAWLRLAALPNVSVKQGSISSRTLGSTGVVE